VSLEELHAALSRAGEMQHRMLLRQRDARTTQEVLQAQQQQQPAQQQRPMQRRSASPLPHLPPPPKTKAMSPLTSNLTAGNITANQLDKLLINLASGGLFAAGASSPPPEDDPAVKTTSFSASFIKVAFKRQGYRFSMLFLQLPPSNLNVSLHSCCSLWGAFYVYQAWPPMIYY